MNEKEIVGAFILNAKLFDEIDCPANLFQGPHCKMVFKRLKAAHRNGHPIDTMTLIADLEKDIPVTFITGLTDAFPKSLATIEVVREKVRRLKNERIGEQIIEEAQSRGEDVLKGMPVDVSKIKALIAEHEIINKSKEQLELENVPMSFKMSEVEEKDVKWLWRNYIPSESITLINGDPDSGKTWWVLDLASRVTRGAVWPDGLKGNEPANVYYMTYEDVISQQIKKRIRKLGADQARFFSFNSEYPLNLLLSEQEGREKLEADLIKIDLTNGLLITDPILDFTGSTNPNAVEFVRPLLTPLAAMAKRLHFSIAMIGHLNKDQMKSIMYRASGSTGGWQGKARAAFLIARETQEKRIKRYVFPIKNNWAWPEPVPMEFEIIDEKLSFSISDIDADSILNPVRGRPPTEKSKAKEIIADMFRGRDEIPSSEIEERTKLMGISEGTLKRVKKEERYISDWRKSENEKAPDYWIWKKPYFKK